MKLYKALFLIWARARGIKNDFTVYGQVIEIGEKTVTINCLIDDKKPQFELRSFEKIPLMGLKNLQTGSVVKISMYTGPGSKHIFYELAEEDMKKYFNQDPKDYFEDFDDPGFFKPLN